MGTFGKDERAEVLQKNPTKRQKGSTRKYKRIQTCEVISAGAETANIRKDTCKRTSRGKVNAT